MSSPYDHVIQALSEFIYDVIEKSRRLALRNVVDAMRRCDGDGHKFRNELEVYLSSNVFSSSVSAMVNAEAIDASKWWAILDEVKNAALATRLVATCRRELESNPNLPGLLFLEGVGALHAAQPEPEQVASTLNTGLENYIHLYDASEEDLSGVAQELVVRMSRVNPTAFEPVIASLVYDYDNVMMARAAYPFVSSPDLKRACASSWIATIAEKSRSFRAGAVGGTGW